MFSTPKWLLFGLIMFGGIHIVSYLMETGAMAEVTQEGISYSPSLVSSFGTAFTWNYSYLDGSWFFLKFIFATVQGVFLFFAAKEIADWIRGR